MNEAAEAGNPQAQGKGMPGPPEPGRHRGLWHVTLPGCWGALIAGCHTFSPSLLPRNGLVQGLLWGITAAFGARAALAVRDLQRAGGFGRADLLVVTPDGEGWVDPALVDSFEYLSAGNCATVAMQYSDLPSWISYLDNQSAARDAGRALFDTVYGAWSRLPPGHRLRLFVSGESLGSFGAEAAFTGENDLYDLTSGALFAGPPSFSPLFGEFRDPGSPAARRSSRSTTAGGSCGSPTMRPGTSPRTAGPGAATGSCT